MKVLKKLKRWCPQPKTPAQTNLRNQNTNMLRIGSFSAKIAIALRVVYGLALIAVLFTTFGVYHSRVEPYIGGSLWGYQLPIGYVGLALGMLAILYPKTILARKYSFGAVMVVIGLFLIISVYVFPKEYFINLIHGTNFSGVQIDVDYPIGNAVTLCLAIFSIIVGLMARINVFIHPLKKKQNGV